MSSPRPVSGPRARTVSRLVLVLALCCLAVLALAGAPGDAQVALLTMLPALALAAVMVARPYVGERAIARLRARGRRRLPTASPMRIHQRPAAALARGGRLIATALAGRAPPPLLAGGR